MMFRKKYMFGLLLLMLIFLSIGMASASEIDNQLDNSNMVPIDDDSLEENLDIESDENSFTGDKAIDDYNENDLIANSDENMISSDISDTTEIMDNADKSKGQSDAKNTPRASKSETKNDAKINANISKSKTKISVNKVNDYYKEKSRLNIYLKDSNNKSIKNKAVKILLNGKTYSKYTDSLGKVSLNLNLKPNKYVAKISFDGDDEYYGSSINASINVKKAPVSIITNSAKSYYHPDTFFKAKVINKITKTPIDGIKVLFKIYSSKNKFKKYYALTDKNGVATLNKRLETGVYDVYTYIKDKASVSYKNPKNKASLRVMNTSEMGCSSIYVHVNENESAIAFRRDSTYAANLHIVNQKWHGRYAVKQYKLTGTYFFHTIVTSDGWLIGTGGWDNPTVNKKIEDLAGKIVSSDRIKASLLKSILAQERKLNSGHFAIVAPNGRYAVVWRSGYIKGKLKNGEYLDVPNVKSLFRYGEYKQFSNNTAKAALKIAATDIFGLNRRNIMVYHYKRTSKNFKTNATVKVYGANDKGNLAGRSTYAIKDNIYYLKKFISKFKLSGTPNQKFLGRIEFGNIDKLFKTQTKVSAKNITGNFNQTKYFKLTLKDKKTKKALKNVRVNLRIYTGKKYKDYYVRTNKKGIAKFNTSVLKVGRHKVLIKTGNNKYIISGKASILIKKIAEPKINNSTNSSVNGTSNIGAVNSTKADTNSTN